MHLLAQVYKFITFRRLDSIRRKERNEAHLYFQVEVYINTYGDLARSHDNNDRFILKDISRLILELI